MLVFPLLSIESLYNILRSYTLYSNSYWLNDKTPCLTYGLRGVIGATIEVSH